MPQRGPLPRRRTSLAILKHATASVRSAPLAATSGFVTGERGELVRRGAERRARELRDLGGHALRPLRVRVEPRADGGAAERELVEAVERPLERRLAEGELRGPAAELLPERERRRVHQVRAPHLDDVLEGRCSSPRSPLRSAATAGKRRSLISSAAATCITVGNTSFDDCERFTSSLGWMGFFEPIVPAGELDRAVRDDLVGVHVRLRAAAGLPDDQREMSVELASDDLVGRAHDEIALGRVELAEVLVGEGRRLLDDAEGPDDRAPEAVAADLEVLQAALRLGAPVPVGPDLDLAHAVRFDAHVHGWTRS